MNNHSEESNLNKVPTGVPGFDRISYGGLPKGRTTLVSGTAGSGKTIFGNQFLAAGIEEHDQNGVFITFEETPEDIRQNLASFGWPIDRWEEEGRWTFIDVSPEVTKESVTGAFDLAALEVRIKNAVEKTGAERVTIDSLSGLYNLFVDTDRVRQEMYRLISTTNEMGLTTILTAERIDEEGGVSRYGVEEFVSDNVIILKNQLVDEIRRRTIEILKFRGSNHQKGAFPFAIAAGKGIEVVQTVDLGDEAGTSTERLTTGIPRLDEMSNGGFFRNSLVLVTGGTGTGKTLTSNHYVNAGYKNDEKVILFANEESKGQIIRNARGWGMDFGDVKQSDRVRIHYSDPRSSSLEERLVKYQNEVREFQPDRVVIDSLSALKRHVTPRSFQEFVLGLCSFLKESGVSALLTSTGSVTDVGESLSHANISTSVDTILMLRYVEMFGTIQRGIMILKMRGTRHEKYIRRFTIDETGITIGEPFENVSGVLTGSLTFHQGGEIEELSRQAREADDEG